VRNETSVIFVWGSVFVSITSQPGKFTKQARLFCEISVK